MDTRIAESALRVLVGAYDSVDEEAGGSVDWSEIDDAARMAREALQEDRTILVRTPRMGEKRVTLADFLHAWDRRLAILTELTSKPNWLVFVANLRAEVEDEARAVFLKEYRKQHGVPYDR